MLFDRRFAPTTISIAVGDRIRWTNDDDPIVHTATSNDGLWDSGFLTGGQTFLSDPFAASGTFPYFCRVHPDVMLGTVVVTG